MNCKHVQELLPLYVGRDLEAKRAQMIAAHVQSCSECAVSVAEYRETRQLLQEFAPPSFDEAVFDGIRQRVLREIEREAPESHKSIAPGLSRLLEGFILRPRWAVAAALLLAVGGSILYFMGKRPGNLNYDRQQVANSGGSLAGPTSASIQGSKDPAPESTVNNKSPVQGLTAGTRHFQPKRTGDAPHRTGPVRVITDPRSLSAQTFPDPSKRDTGSPLDPVAAQKTLRVEIQTNDPNIRIIWFSPQPTRQDSPAKFSKGT